MVFNQRSFRSLLRIRFVGGLKRTGLYKGRRKSKGYMKDNLPDWIEDSIRDLTKSYKNRLRVHRIQKIVRLFKIDVTKL
jgi:hypothetical protein